MEHLREENDRLKKENETLRQAIDAAYAAGVWYYDYPVVKPSEVQPSELEVANNFCLGMSRERYAW